MHIHGECFIYKDAKISRTRARKSEGILELCSCESSAKKWYEWPDLQMTLLRDCMYKVNNRGPRTEPCGTPHFKEGGADS